MWGGVGESTHRYGGVCWGAYSWIWGGQVGFGQLAPLRVHPPVFWGRGVLGVLCSSSPHNTSLKTGAGGGATLPLGVCGSWGHAVTSQCHPTRARGHCPEPPQSWVLLPRVRRAACSPLGGNRAWAVQADGRRGGGHPPMERRPLPARGPCGPGRVRPPAAYLGGAAGGAFGGPLAICLGGGRRRGG